MIVADVRLRDELALCHTWGIPHSRFLSWPELDQDKALAYAAYDRAVCKGCGTREEEWDENQGGHRDAYAPRVYICPGCQVRGDLEHDLAEQERERAGQYIVLIPREQAERQAAELAARRAVRGGAD